jgi:hypothetical protein
MGRPTLIIPRLPVTAPDDAAAEARLTWFHPRSSPVRPDISVRISHDGSHLRFRWQLLDSGIVSRIRTTNGPVCQDSCVEWFAQPEAGGRYINLEINAGGVRHAAVIDPSLRARGDSTAIRFIDPACLERLVEVHSTLPAVVDPEIAGPLSWDIEVTVPLKLFSEAFPKARLSGRWRCNMYHCADQSSLPRWAAWSPIGDQLCFHQPDHFGIFHFQD